MSSVIDRSHLLIRKRPQAALRLICFCYAGGSAGLYLPYAALLHPALEILAVQLPGRGGRLRETPVCDWKTMRALIAREILPLADRPCLLFGHSFGTRMVYETARLMAAQGQAPRHVFLSGALPPHVTRTRPSIHELPTADFLAEIAAMGGTPPELLENQEMMQLLLPMLRADFCLSDGHVPAEAPPFEFPATVLLGDCDNRTLQGRASEWQRYFRSDLAIQEIRGAHFFIDTNREAVAQEINSVVETVCETAF